MKPCFADDALYHFAIIKTATNAVYMLSRFCYLLLFPIGVYTKREVAKFLIFKAISEMTSHIFLVIDKFRGFMPKQIETAKAIANSPQSEPPT